MSEQLNVLIVDDAAFMRKAVTDILKSDPGIHVVGTAQNGLEALDKIKSLHPDVVTLDIDMPIMDGIMAIRHIMIEAPIPIVVLSSLIHDGSITFEALRLGVVDFIPKPSGAISLNIDRSRQQIIDRVKVAHSVNLENLRRVRLSSNGNGKIKSEKDADRSRPEYLIVLGTTLSGPNTIIRLISQLPADLPASIIVVQEIAPRILPSFVERFNQYVSWKIEEAQDGLPLRQGTCYLGSNEYSLKLRATEEGAIHFELGDGTPRPLDLLFSSAAALFRQKTVGVLLTGVGEDGAEGFARIKQEQGTTLVEDTQCCVYPNLANNAIQQGMVDHVLHEVSLPGAIASTVAWPSVLPGN
jgi:two-component system, chemotaxis family, protein-glutamate methylesterase/glutaminase